MRCELALAFAALGVAGCAVDLESEPTGAGKSGDEALPPVAAGCKPFAAVPEAASAQNLQSIELADGRLLWIAGSVGITTSGATLADCVAHGELWSGDGQPLIQGSHPERRYDPLDGAQISGKLVIYYEAFDPDPGAPFGWANAGIGSSTDGIAAELLLWTSDRPRFGTATALVGDELYAWGCAPGDFLSADCFLARAAIDDLGAHEYARGGGFWTPNVDQAWPLVEAGLDVDIAPLPNGRWLMAYATPLGTELVLRSGPSAAGPWSKPVVAARCALPEDDPEAFCHHVSVHPALDAPAGAIAVTYAVGSFSGKLVPEPLTLQLASVPIPSELP